MDKTVEYILVGIIALVIIWVAAGSHNDSGERCSANDGTIYGACEH